MDAKRWRMGGALLLLLLLRHLEKAGYVGEIVHDRHIARLEPFGFQKALPGMLQVVPHVLRRVDPLPIVSVKRI